MFKLQHLSKTFSRRRDRDHGAGPYRLQIEAGEYLAITGPSGCGKSTLLGILGLFDALSSGEYWFDGHNVAGWSERQLNTLLGPYRLCVFQSFNLIDDSSAWPTTSGLALGVRRPPGPRAACAVAEVMERLGLTHRAPAGHRPSSAAASSSAWPSPARLPPGRRCCWPTNPPAATSTAHGAEVMRIPRELNAEGTTLVMVTHSPEHAAQASRTLRLLLDGRVVVDAVAAVA